MDLSSYLRPLAPPPENPRPPPPESPLAPPENPLLPPENPPLLELPLRNPEVPLLEEGLAGLTDPIPEWLKLSRRPGGLA